jgi:serine phosphatase RsbU (regulator of sigma subunit)
MDQQTFDNQLTVVVSGALSLATLAVGESSPFRGIARRVFVGDLSEEDSQKLILEFLLENSVSATPQALHRLLLATRGDVYLIRKISQRGAELVHGRASERLSSRDVNTTINRFLRQEVFQYAPLVEAVRLIEDDPDLLECIIQLLEQERVSRASLPLPLSPDLDPLYLTGVVEKIDSDHYRLQNMIYRKFLAQHFTPGRVGHVLAMTGRWDSAIDYLESSILQGSRQSRADILPATINSIYASQDLPQAVHFLQRGLSAAFGVPDSRLWFSPPQEKHLQLVGPTDLGLDGHLQTDLQILLTADRLEARAYRQQVPLRGQESGKRLLRAIPLMIPGSKPVGVITLYDEPAEDSFNEQRERDLQLIGFLNQAARALQTVSLRRQELVLAGRVQASLLPHDLPEIPGWQITATWRPARETSGDFYDFIPLPDGRLGIVIADVVDKGMGPALLMALSRTLIRTYAASYPQNPEQLLQVTNQRIIADMNAELFVTIFYGMLDPLSGRLIYCNAGHPPPYILSTTNKTSLTALHKTGMALGIMPDVTWQAATVEIPPGGLLLMYTDGVYEAQNHAGEFFGEEQMLTSVQTELGQPVQNIQETLMSRLYAFAGNGPQVDDTTVVILGRDLSAV